MVRSTLRVLLALWVTLLMTGSCSHKLKGPSPTIKCPARAKMGECLTYCGADQQVLVVTGTGLSPMVKNGAKSGTPTANTDAGDPTVQLPKVCLTNYRNDAMVAMSGPEICIPETDVQWISQQEIRFVIRPVINGTTLQPGYYDVTVTNPDGTKAQGNVYVHVLAGGGPIVFWADPNLLYNGISTQITAYGSNLATLDTMVIVNSAGVETPLCSNGPVDGGAAVPMCIDVKDNRVQGVVPKGTPVDTYDLILRSPNGCEAPLPDGITVRNEVDPAMLDINPTFAYAGEATSVTISSKNAGFSPVPVPRVYLNPTNGMVATALGSVTLVGNVLTALVPKNMPAGQYDVYVVNPDGKIWLAQGAF
ncbi:MAG TPA: hypothetical protein VGJ84_00280, partial [Polyangiaceae bacterium]